MRKLPLLLMISLIVISGCGKKAVDDPILGSYDGGQVSQSELQAVLESLPEGMRRVALREKHEFIESYITEKLLLQEAEGKGLQHLEDVQQLLSQARKKILVAKLIEQEIDPEMTVSEDRKAAFYQNHKDEYMNPYRLQASHILLRSREEAQAVLIEVRDGLSFAEAAKKYSLDPTANRGGDLGMFQKGELIPEIEEAAFSLSKDEISEPIQTSYGFHLIQVTAIHEPQMKDFASVEKEIERKILIEDRSRLFKGLTERVKAKGQISLNEAQIAKFNLESTPAS